jgi:inner membrane protein
MLLRTHLAIVLFFILLLLPAVNSKFIFVTIALIATLIPDVDSRFSKIGHKKIARVLQFFTKHRGAIHSFTFLIMITFALALFVPVIALGFFLGYGVHLLADSFTIEGIRPFYPSRMKSSGVVRTDGKSETTVLVLFVILDIFMMIYVVF